jgi:uncharacterized GH25 family protein
MLPSGTVMSGNDPWVTVDGAVSNDLFYPDHFPLQLKSLAVTAPDGSAVQAEHESTGRYRSTFDVHLTQQGTYRMAVASAGVFASYKGEDGKPKRWRGSAEDFSKEVPANAPELKVTEMDSRVETFVTVGKPTDTALRATGKGLELVPVTHPTDLVAKEQATFRLLLDGKPAADAEIMVVPGGSRYRDKLGDFKVRTDADGKFAITWPTPGMYWIGASGAKPSFAGATERRSGYAATFEVLPE